MGYSPRGRKELDMTERLHFLSFPIIDKSEDNYYRVILGGGVYIKFFSNTGKSVYNPFSGGERIMKCFLEEMTPLRSEVEKLSKCTRDKEGYFRESEHCKTGSETKSRLPMR